MYISTKNPALCRQKSFKCYVVCYNKYILLPYVSLTFFLMKPHCLFRHVWTESFCISQFRSSLGSVGCGQGYHLAMQPHWLFHNNNILLIWRIFYPAITTYYLHSVYHTDKIVLSLNSPESWQKTFALYILGDEGATTFSNAPRIIYTVTRPRIISQNNGFFKYTVLVTSTIAAA
jgi:hypothetical protein